MQYTAVIRLRRIPSPAPVTDPTEGYTLVQTPSADDFEDYYILDNGAMVKVTDVAGMTFDAEGTYYTKD